MFREISEIQSENSVSFNINRSLYRAKSRAKFFFLDIQRIFRNLDRNLKQKFFSFFYKQRIWSRPGPGNLTWTVLDPCNLTWSVLGRGNITWCELVPGNFTWFGLVPGYLTWCGPQSYLGIYHDRPKISIGQLRLQ